MAVQSWRQYTSVESLAPPTVAKPGHRQFQWSSTFTKCGLTHRRRIVAAAAAVGLLLSNDDGRSWNVIADGLELTDSLAVAVLPDEVLFSIQDGPFAERSQIWRWQVNGQRIEQVREGLPLWLKGKVDTGHIAASKGQAAVVDGGGDLWLSRVGSTGWDLHCHDLSTLSVFKSYDRVSVRTRQPAERTQPTRGPF